MFVGQRPLADSESGGLASSILSKVLSDRKGSLVATEQVHRRARRDRRDIRELLLQSAIVEFGQKGFEGASTRAIAERIDAHQPQINYHFSSKEDLWRAVVDKLFAGLDEAILDPHQDDPLPDRFARMLKRMCRYASEYPQLNQIMVHEASSPGVRLAWITNTHVRWRHKHIIAMWRQLRSAGLAAPIDDDVFYYFTWGAGSLPYMSASEATLLGTTPQSDDFIKRHGEALVATLLPGWVPSST